MRQRAAIARALAIEPALLLMDEPFGSLDAQNRRIMQAEVKRIWAETGKTIVFVTHAIEEAVSIGTTLVMMSARPARVRELIRNDGGRDRHALVDHLNQVIMEEVLRQQGAGGPVREAARSSNLGSSRRARAGPRDGGVRRGAPAACRPCRPISWSCRRPPPCRAENARFAGRWIGKWEEQLDHVLIVELLVQNDQTTEVIAVYSWGVSAELGVGSPGWTRVRGRIENGALRLELTRVQATAVYTMQADGTLVGEYLRGDRVTSRARLTRAVREGP